MTFSLVIPVYNEELGIENTIKHLDKYKQGWENDFEVILVNDGSTDNTKDILNRLNLDSTYKIIEHPRNLGYGASLKTGIKNANSEIIVITDADETYPNERVDEFVNMFISENRDMLVGARIGDNVKIPLIRKPAKKTINMLANYLTGIQIPDLNSGFRVMKKSVLNKFLHILPDGFSFTTTITLAMLTNNYNVKYEKIDYFHRSGKSKIRPIRDTINFVVLIIRTTVLFNPLKVLLPVSFILMFIGMAFAVIRYLNEGGFSVLSLMFFILGIQFFTTAILADLIVRRTRS